MSILNKIFFFSLGVTFLFLTLGTNILSNYENENLTKFLENKISNHQKLLKKSISSLLFDLNKDVINIQLQLLYQDEDIVQVELIDYSKVINIHLDTKQFDAKDIIKNSIILSDGNDKLGLLNIYYTKKNIDIRLNSFKNKMYVIILFLTITLFLLIFYYMKSAVKSLEELTKVTKEVANGNLSVTIDINNSNDEIGELTNSFKVMINTIKGHHEKFEKQLKFQHILLDSINIPVYIKDIKGKYIDCNKEFAKFFGKSKEEIIGKKMNTLLEDKFLEEQIEIEKKLVEKGGSITYENNFPNAKGELRDLIQFKTIYEEEKEKWIISTYVDITERNISKKKIDIFSHAIKQSPVSIIITDTNANIEYVNEYFEKVSGFSIKEVRGQKPKFLQSKCVTEEKYDEIWNSINVRGVWEGEIQIRKKSGELYWEHIYFSTILNDNNRLINYLAVKENITLKKEQEAKLEYQANFDILTKLPNRVLFNDRVTQLLKETKRDEFFFAVLFIDLDNFKKVNDTLGHKVGDLLLIEVANRFTSLLKKEDTISRFGGDEFTILLSQVSDIEDIKDTVAKILMSFEESFVVNGNKLTVTTSIGITTSLDSSNSIEDLLKNSDIAMYKAKENGKNSFVFFNEKLNEEITKKVQIENYMMDALSNNEFEVYFQSQIDIKSSKIISAEALLRWHCPKFDFISPEEFIPIAEQTGLIIKIGEFVIKKSIELLAQVKLEFGKDFKIAVNVSPKQLLNKNLPNFIKNELDNNNIDPKYLEIEITEGVLIDNTNDVKNRLNELRDIGMSISLDDFGTGYSSLSYLRMYPFDVIKIDKSFMDEHDYSLVNTIISMAHSLNLEVVAEGIETQNQLDMLNKLNCNIGQGYLFSKPIPKNAFLEYMKREKKIEKKGYINI